MCVHTQYLHKRAFTPVHVCMANVASYIAFNLSYNATIMVTVLIPYGALAAHQMVEEGCSINTFH